MGRTSHMKVPVFEEVGFEDNHAPFSYPPFHFRDEPSIEEVEIGDQVVSLLLNRVGIKVGKDRTNRDTLFSGQSAGLSQADFRQIHRVYFKTMLRQEDGISPFPCGKVESPSSREKAKMPSQEEVGRFPEGESLSFKSFIP